MAVACGNFDADRLDEVVLACTQENGSLAAILFNSDGSRLAKVVGGVCSQIDVAAGQFDRDDKSEFVVSLIQSDGTLAAIVFDHDGRRLFKGVGGKAFAPRVATGNFDANSLDDEYVIALQHSDGTLAAITFQANGQRMRKVAGGPASNIDIAAGELKSGNGAYEEYAVSVVQTDGRLAVITFSPDSQRIGKGVAGSGASSQVPVGRFPQTSPLSGPALGVMNTSETPSIIFFSADGTRLGKGATGFLAQKVGVGACDFNNDGSDEGIVAYVDREGRLKWAAFDAYGRLVQQSL